MVTVTSTVPVRPARWRDRRAAELYREAGRRVGRPNSTAVAPARLVPVMVTLVPPPVGPAVGLIELTVGLEVGELVGRRGRRDPAGCGDGHVDRAAPCR